MDYNSIPFRNRDIEVITKKKEGPNRVVTKRIMTDGQGNKTVVKEVDSKRGYKAVTKVNGQRSTVGKSY